MPKAFAEASGKAKSALNSVADAFGTPVVFVVVVVVVVFCVVALSKPRAFRSNPPADDVALSNPKLFKSTFPVVLIVVVVVVVFC